VTVVFGSVHGSLFDESKPERQVNLNAHAGMSAYFDLEMATDIFFPELASVLYVGYTMPSPCMPPLFQAPAAQRLFCWL
jgi:hypothetical protein